MKLRDAMVPLLDRCFRTGGILSYHAIVDGDVPSPAMHVSAATLRTQLEYVRERYEVVSLRELIARRCSGRTTDRCIAITFDDAYRGVERHAAPILSRLDLPATIFVAVDSADSGGSFWWDHLEHARRRSTTKAWLALVRELGIPLSVTGPPGLETVRDAIVGRFAGRLDISRLPRDPAMPLHPLLGAMDFAALRRLARDDRFEFGCHTMTHPALPYLLADEQEAEMRVAHARLRDELPRVLPVVAYPFGLYDARTVKAAQRAGFAAAVTMQPRAIHARDGSYTLPRVGTSEDWSGGAISLRVNAGLRPLFIAAMGGRHPRLRARGSGAVA